MDDKKSHIFNNNSSNKKRVVMNDSYYNYRKKSLIKKGILGITAFMIAGTCWYIKEVPVRAEVIINNNVIEWTTQKKNLEGVTFQILKNGAVVSETDSFKYVDENQVDTVAPSDIEKITTQREIDGLKITWKEPKDMGENNIYQVFAVNKRGRKLFKTEEVYGGFVSGISKYIVKFNGKEFETAKPEFIINSKDIKKGAHTIEIKAIDNAGNKSKFKKFDFTFNTVDFKFENGKLVPQNSKYTNDKYNFYIIDKELASSGKEIPQYDKNMFLLNQDILSILDSNTKPNMTVPSYTVKNNEVIFSWSNPKVSSNTYSFYVEIVNKETLQKGYSDLIEINGSSNILGYHYMLNTSSSYTVRPTDKYTDDNSISMDLSTLDKSKKHYFHIATIDSSGMVSGTKTIPVNLNTSNPLTTKINELKKFISKVADTSNDNITKITTYLANNLTLDNIKKLSNDNVKIYVINENFSIYLKENYDIEAENDFCVKRGKDIYFNGNKDTDLLLQAVLGFIS